MTDKPVNPVEQYFIDNRDKKNKYSELFTGNDDYIDQMTDLEHADIRDIASLHLMDRYIQKKGLKPVFLPYYHKFMRLMVSHDRKSRLEYVDVHKADRIQEANRGVLGGGNV